MSEHEPLALRHRPRHFIDVAGQTASAAILYQMAVRRKLPPGMLFTGPRGTGKTSTARILGAALNCAEPPGPAASWPCGSCPSCLAVANGTSLSVREIDAASNNGVEDIRKLRDEVLYGTGGEWHAVILDECHAMSNAAYDAMLKVLEQPPPNTLFLLLTTELGKVLPTVRSRCMRFPFRPVPVSAITARLAYICEAEGIPAEAPLLAAIAESAQGGMRDAIMTLDQLASAGVTSLAAWRELTGESDFAPAIIEAAASGDYPAMFSALDAALCATGDYSWITGEITNCLKDMLVLSAGGSISATGDALFRRQQLGAAVGPVRLMSALKVLWELATRVRTENKRDGLNLAVAMLSERLCPPASPAVSNGHRPVSGAELTEMMR